MFDPFVGAGSVSIHYARAGCRVVMGDTNERLIGVYQHLLTDPLPVIEALRLLDLRHATAEDPRASYFAARAVFNASAPTSVESAAGFLWTMNAGFNGVVRFNQGGACNTPYGEPEPGKAPGRAHELVALGGLLRARRARLVVGDFEVTCADAKKGDVVYFDPPYVAPAALGKGPGFVGYSPGGFTLADRKRLGLFLRELDQRGALWVLSDLSADHALEVYGLWNVAEVSVRRSVAPKGKDRGRAREVIVTNF